MWQFLDWNPQMDHNVLENQWIMWQAVNLTLFPIPKGVMLIIREALYSLTNKSHYVITAVQPIAGYAFYEWRIKSYTAATELPDNLRNHTSTSQQRLPTTTIGPPTPPPTTPTPAHVTVFLIPIRRYRSVWRRVTACPRNMRPFRQPGSYNPQGAIAILWNFPADVRFITFHSFAASSQIHLSSCTLGCGQITSDV